MIEKDLITIKFTEYELKWLHWALGEIVSHPLWSKDYPTGKILIKKVYKTIKEIEKLNETGITCI